MKKNNYMGEDSNGFGWSQNPFTFKILPELFIGYEDEMKSVERGIKKGSKVTLLLGPTGSGKTTLLKRLIMEGIDSEILYLPKPPKVPEDLVNIFLSHVDKGFISRLFTRKNNVNLYSLSDYVNMKLKGQQIVLIIDEAHEATIETMEWLRTISDQITSMTLVLAGLPVLENKIKNELETFYRRVDTKVKLTNLSRIETRELIKRRIEWAGGEDIKPFTARMIDFIYEKTGGFPREILRACHEYVELASKKGVTMIDIDISDDIEERHRSYEFKREAPPVKEVKNKVTVYESIDELPQKQRDIIDILTEAGKGLTPTEIVERMNPKEYKNKDNAIRSVNNILRRMGAEGLVIRERKGKAYKYSLSETLKTATVKT